MKEDLERGPKWSIRYIIVPIIVAMVPVIGGVVFKMKTTKNTKPEDNVTNEVSQEVFYDIFLYIPSFMTNATITVDDEPAVILADSTITAKRLRIAKKNTPHKFELIKDGRICAKNILVRENNITIQPCQ